MAAREATNVSVQVSRGMGRRQRPSAVPMVLLAVLVLLAACRTAPPPPPPPAETVVATSDPNVVLDTVSLAPGEWRDYQLSIPAGVRETFDVVYLELGNAGAGAVLELRSATYWHVVASSASAQRFVRGAISGVPQPVPPAGAAVGATETSGPTAVTENRACLGPCIIFDATGGINYARVVNDGASSLTADLYLYGYDLQDDTEPQNDQRASAPVLQAEAAGAIELLGDLDYWLLAADSQVTLASVAGVEPEAHVADAAGLIVAGPHLPGQSFTVCAGESLRVRASGNASAGAPAASTYFLSAVPQASSTCPRRPAFNEVVAGLSPNEVLDTRRYGAGESVAFELGVPSSVRSQQVLYVELDADVDLELRGSGGGAIASSFSSHSFFAGALGFGAGGEPGGSVQPSAISTAVACRGSCVIVEPDASSYRVVVTNRGASRNVSLYAYGSDLTDEYETQNDSPGSSPVLIGSDGGAIETIGDLDHWYLPNGGSVAFDVVAGGIALEAEIVDASGKPVLNSGGPFGSGDVLEVFAGEYVRVWARDAQQAAASGNSGYFLERFGAGSTSRRR